MEIPTMLKVLILVLAFAAVTTFTATSPSFGYWLLGPDRMSCGSWLAERHKNVALEAWVLGFLSGIGYIGPSDPLRGLDRNAVAYWIDNYCRANPIARIEDAAAALSLAHPR